MSHKRILAARDRRVVWGARPIHNLEYLLLALSDRIRRETGNDDLANAASQLASASHDYELMAEPEPLFEMCEDWKRRFSASAEQSAWQEDDNFGIGILNDGSMLSYTEEEARKAIAERDASENGRPSELLPQSVRYIKNGGGGKWWAVAKAGNQLHAKWDEVPPELLQKPNAEKIRACYQNRKLKIPTQDLNALLTLIRDPSQHVWVTFEDGFLWWCLVVDGVTDLGPSTDGHGHFCISCQPQRGWSNKSLGGEVLKIVDLPGPVSSTAGFRGTVCEPAASEQILRVIRGEKNPVVVQAQRSRRRYEADIELMIKQLHWRDFELLIGLIFDQTGWTRWSAIGGTQKSIDVDVKNLVSEEHAYVQIKSEASQAELNEYIEDFKTKPQYARLVFAVHTTASEKLQAGEYPNVHIWAGERLAKLILDAGMGAWLETKLA